MSLMNAITMCGGLAFFLYGMTVMSHGLEKRAGSRLEYLLKSVTSNKYKGLLLGILITIAVQSSSATTVMLVGLVNSGIMELSQTIGVIMGANIGTTLTAWLLSLSGISSENILLQLVKPASFAPILALIAAMIIMLSKSGKKRDIGTIMMGFAILMYGMVMMSDAVSPLSQIPQFTSILTMFNNPLLGVLIGTAVTAVIQSSAATVGILQALSLTGNVTYGMAIPLIMGQNIGTCMTAVISAFGANRKAKRVVAAHIYFNVIGTVVLLSLYSLLNSVFKFAFNDMAINPAGIALVHSLFNLITTAVLMPFTKQLEKLATISVPDRKGKDKVVFLDERLLLSPSLAIIECEKQTVLMARLAQTTLTYSLDLLNGYDAKKAEAIEHNEEVIDNYEDKLGTFLVKLSSKELADSDSEQITKLLHSIGDFERISDHALNIKHSFEEMQDKDVHFSAEAKGELEVMSNAIREILGIAIESFCQNDVAMASHVEPLEQVVDELREQIKLRHIRRLKQGKCTIELGFILSDLLGNFERVSDHCSNIAVCVIEVKQSAFDTHMYLNDIKTSGSTAYVNDFASYQKKYALPELKKQAAAKNAAGKS